MNSLEIARLRRSLILIGDVCLDYDGYNTVEDLKRLIDEIKDIAYNAANGIHLLDRGRDES